MIKLIERIRQDAEHETLAAAAWMAWLKFGTSPSGHASRKGKIADERQKPPKLVQEAATTHPQRHTT
jgi:hypothetical protein